MEDTRTGRPSAGEVGAAVRARRARGAAAVEPALCCPVQYDGKCLDALPAEILDKDCGCGEACC